jgi:hypothetical protein
VTDTVHVVVTPTPPIHVEVSSPAPNNPPDIVIDTGGVSRVDPDSIAYHHVQGLSSSTWDVVHGLGFHPNVTVMDSAGSMVEGELEHLSKNQLRVTFSAPISGNAYLS